MKKGSGQYVIFTSCFGFLCLDTAGIWLLKTCATFPKIFFRYKWTKKTKGVTHWKYAVKTEVVLVMMMVFWNDSSN